MKFLLLIFFCQFQLIIWSQNLLINNSFESYTSCPMIPGQIQNVQPWNSPTWGSTDYFNSCTVSLSVSTPLNYVGFSPPKSGSAYAGIVAYCNSGCISNNSREYLQVRINSPLKRNRRYCIQYYISLADSSQYSISNIGVFFHEDSLFKTTFDTISVVPQIEYLSQINDTSNWMEVKDYFIANGGEKYLTIGNFRDNASTNVQYFQPIYTLNLERFAYYYIDDVSLVECNETPIIPNVFSPNDDGINDLFKIEDLPQECSVQIFDRWGIIVFESNNQNTYWNGRTTSGINCVEGCYFYRIIAGDEVYKGFLQLIR